MKPKIISLSGKKGHGKDLVAKIIQALCSNDQWHRDNIYKSVTEWEGNFDNLSKYQKKSWSEKLKKIVAMLLGIDVELLDDRDYKYSQLPEKWWYITDDIFTQPYTPEIWEKYQKLNINYRLVKPTPRWFMQRIGTEAMRKNLHPNTWVNSLFADYKPHCYATGSEQETDFCEKELMCSGECKSKYYPQHWIITDTRFPNEFEAVKERDGVTIKVERYKTSQSWQEEFRSWFLVLDPDGWNREKFSYSWFEEKITQNDFINRMKKSTCKFYKPKEDFFESVNHESETALDDYENSKWDYVIKNDGSIHDLIDKVRVMCKELNIK